MIIVDFNYYFFLNMINVLNFYEKIINKYHLTLFSLKFIP